MRTRGRAWLSAALITGAVLTASLAGCTKDENPGAPKSWPKRFPMAGLSRLSVQTDQERPRIVDAGGREVLLRGANLNTLGDYYQGDPDLVPTKPPTDDDWDAMASSGFSVVRLLVSWSRFEPERRAFDEDYLGEVRAAVREAAHRGIYTVIDFHQDAWGKHIASPDDVQCRKGVVPAIGWDGAAEWATLTDGADTCRPEGYREGAPAVAAAFESFYANRDGIRDRYVATVARVAGAFADEPAVAGYDLFNEPNKVGTDEVSEQRYTELVVALTAAIRATESEAEGGFDHLLFLEPVVLFPLPGTLPTMGQPDDPNIVFAPHNYAEVIVKVLTVEQTFDVSADTAAERGWPLWIGEYGVFDVDEPSLDILRRFAEVEDAHLAGSAEWQWRQRCGDPHTVAKPGGTFEGDSYHLNVTTCPADTSVPNEDFLRIVGRAFPRAAPGRLAKIESDPEKGALVVAGTVDVDAGEEPGDLAVWVPGRTKPDPETAGLGSVRSRRVEGGWYLIATPTADDYRLELRPR